MFLKASLPALPCLALLMMSAGCRPRTFNDSSVQQAATKENPQIITSAGWVYTRTNSEAALTDPASFLKKAAGNHALNLKVKTAAEIPGVAQAGNGLYLAANAVSSWMYGDILIAVPIKAGVKLPLLRFAHPTERETFFLDVIKSSAPGIAYTWSSALSPKPTLALVARDGGNTSLDTLLDVSKAKAFDLRTGFDLKTTDISGWESLSYHDLSTKYSSLASFLMTLNNHAQNWKIPEVRDEKGQLNPDAMTTLLGEQLYMRPKGLIDAFTKISTATRKEISTNATPPGQASIKAMAEFMFMKFTNQFWPEDETSLSEDIHKATLEILALMGYDTSNVKTVPDLYRKVTAQWAAHPQVKKNMTTLLASGGKLLAVLDEPTLDTWSLEKNTYSVDKKLRCLMRCPVFDKPEGAMKGHIVNNSSWGYRGYQFPTPDVKVLESKGNWTKVELVPNSDGEISLYDDNGIGEKERTLSEAKDRVFWVRTLHLQDLATVKKE